MCPDEDIAKCLIPFHVMTGCDANSCFYGHGKLLLYDKMAKSAEARILLSKCGESLPLSDDALDDLNTYVIRYIYGDVHSTSLELARAAKWKKQKKNSLMRLPPDEDSLQQHIKRANFLAYVQRHPDLRGHPSPIGHGWELVNGCCRPVRHTKPALPLSLPPLQDDCDSDSEADSNSEADCDCEADSDSEVESEAPNVTDCSDESD